MTVKSASIKDVRRVWDIPKNGEFRFEVDFNEIVSIKLLNGSAEVYGMELCMNKEYEIRGTKLAIFTYEGAKVQVRGKCDVEYISEETMMHVYLNTHLAIEEMRKEAGRKQAEVPRVIVMGQSRSTVSRILLNYAIRAGKSPMYADLDVMNGNLLLPGVIGSHVVEKLIDVEEGFGEFQPCMYFYGSTQITDNPKLYRRLLSRLAFAVNGRLATMDDPLRSGAIICTGADSEEYIAEIQEQFKVNLVLVVGNERLHSSVSKHLKERPNCTVLKLPKSGGVVQKDATFRRNLMQYQFQRYFYGSKQEYSPFSIIIPSDDLQIRRLGEDILAPKSALPLGATRKVDENKAAKVDPTSSNLLYSILAISWATTEDQLNDANIAGFIYIAAVDEGKKQITALSVCPGKLPTSYVLKGSLKWIEK